MKEFVTLLCSTAFCAAALLGWCLIGLSALETIEVAEFLCYRRTPPRRPPSRRRTSPFVSLHVPISSEPPEVVLRTLTSLRDLDYEPYEVLVIDNNTKDDRLWQPIEAFCRRQGPPFVFHRLPHCPGFKAGALNHLLTHTAGSATLVGIIDSDYEVEPRYLDDLVGFFEDSAVGFVQTPQDYRAWDRPFFLRICYWEYWQFFLVSMRLRDRRNAILLHGTMVLIRKDLLVRAGAWSEWCLTEDSELGLRLLVGRCRGLYVSKSYGRGLTPYSVSAYKRQRRRWVQGGVQQFKRHMKLFIPGRRETGGLTGWQAFHVLQGWIPWLRDAVVVLSLPVSACCALVLLAGFEAHVSVAPLALGLACVLTHLLFRQWLICRVHLGLSWRDTAGCTALLSGLTWTIGSAWLSGWFNRRPVFRRTPKSIQNEPHWSAAVRTELLLGTLMLGLALCMMVRIGTAGSCSAAALLLQTSLLLPAGWVALVAAAVTEAAPSVEGAKSGTRIDSTS